MLRTLRRTIDGLFDRDAVSDIEVVSDPRMPVESQIAIHQALRKLSRRESEVVTLTHLEGCPHQNI